MGADSIVYELYAQNFARFVGGARGHGQPPWYFLEYFWSDFFPWSFVAPWAVVWWIKTGHWRDRQVELALWWFGAFFVFLSIAVTKRQVYLLPAYPAMALLLAPWIDRVVVGGKDAPSPWPVRALAVFLTAFFAMLGGASLVAVIGFNSLTTRMNLDAYELQTAINLRWPLAVLGLVLALAAAWVFAAWKRRRSTALPVRIAVVMLAVYAVLYGLVLPSLNPIKSYKQQSEWIRDQIGEETHFGLYFPKDNMAFRKRGGFAYYSGRLVTALDTPHEVDAFFAEHPGSVVLVEVNSAPGLFAGDEAAWRARVIRELTVTGRHYFVVAAQREPER
jgi:4-amino-4-deoxy-L-arabinose transferase-like glycosyltransferase